MASENDTEVNLEIELFVNYPEAILQVGYYCCILFVIFGIPGNLITIVALATCKKFHNATAFLIINLHISNLIFCCMILPLTAEVYYAKKWIFGRTMCNVYPFMKYALNATAHFTVVAITVNRYIIVCHPRIYPKLHKRKYLIMSIMATWITAFALFLPTLFGVWGKFDVEPRGGGICTMVADTNTVCPKDFFLGLAFLGPFIVILICYARVWWVVRQTTKKRRANNPNALPPTMSISGSETLVVENHPEVTASAVHESSTEDEGHKLKTKVNSSPDNRQSAIAKYFPKSFKMHRIRQKLQLPTRKDKRLATMIAAILFTLILCHLPIMVIQAIYEPYQMNPVADILTHLIEYSVTFINPVIYVIMSVEYRQAYISLFKNLKYIMTCSTL